MELQTQTAQLTRAIEELRQEIECLGQRIAVLEAAVAERPSSVAPLAAGGLSEELVLVMSAAIAAFLGEKPRIRQVRLLGTGSWAQQGRATIQASHVLPVHHS